MTNTENARIPLDEDTKMLARKMARIMWRLDNPEKVKADQKDAFKEEAKDYSKKALRILQAMRANGVEFRQTETEDADAS